MTRAAIHFIMARIANQDVIASATMDDIIAIMPNNFIGG